MTLSPEVLDTLKTIRITGNRTTMPMLDRKLYVKVNEALECLGGKWDRKAKAHVWDCDPNDPIAEAVATGEVTDWKKEFQFFETPPELANRMVEKAGINAGDKVLEPSAGTGAILKCIRPEAVVVAVELNHKMCDRIKVVFFPVDREMPRFSGNGHSHAIEADFLMLDYSIGKFDRIIMNPPFNKKQDVMHVTHALCMLKPKGRLVAITSPGWTFRTDALHTAFRELMQTLNAEVEPLPAGTFKASGTNVNTVLITIDNE